MDRSGRIISIHINSLEGFIIIIIPIGISIIPQRFICMKAIISAIINTFAEISISIFRITMEIIIATVGQLNIGSNAAGGPTKKQMAITTSSTTTDTAKTSANKATGSITNTKAWAA